MIGILSLVNYLLGSIPFGLLIGKMRGVDVRKIGSGNIGATNVYRGLGIQWGLLVGICDFLKGFVAATLAVSFFTGYQAVLVAFFSILGHIFPVWLKGKGGKGVSTTAGVLCVFLGWKVAVYMLLVWILFLAATKLMSLVNCVFALSFPVLLWLRFKDVPITAVGVLMTGLIWWAHRSNIVRLYAGKEKKLTF